MKYIKFLINNALLCQNYELDNDTLHRDYIYTPSGLTVIAENGTPYYIVTDYLGSIVRVMDSSGHVLNRLSYDAWGRRRSPDYWKSYSINGDEQLRPMFDRGYTGHEHLDEFDIINMNGRLYNPTLGRFLSPDPYVADNTSSQDFNRYSYCRNNPMKYTDPSGEFLGFSIFRWGYEMDKYLFPFVFKLNIHITNGRIGFGYDYSYGIPKAFPISYRKHHGETDYRKYYDNGFKGKETRDGAEWSYGGIFSFSGTKYTVNNGRKDFNQTTNKITFGFPFFFSMSYENDYMFGKKLPGVPVADGGDRWRTAAAEIQIWGVTFGVNMITGDPGFDFNERVEKNGVYVAHDEYDPDKYRLGLFYIGIGPLMIGRNSEQIRHVFQNQFAHDFLMNGKPVHFKVLKERKSKWYFGFDTGTGGSLW